MRRQPIRVLYVINGLGTGGAERSLAEMLPLLPRHGIQPAVACMYRRSEGVEAEVLTSGVQVHFLASRTMLGRVRELRQLTTRERPHLIHTTIFDSDLVGSIAAVGTAIPVISSLVNMPYDPARLVDASVRRYRLRVAQGADIVRAHWLVAHHHAITEAVKASAVRHLRVDPSRITVILRGRDATRLGTPGHQRRAAARQAFRIPPQAELVANVGRQEFQKGQVHLLRAVSALQNRRADLLFLQAGRRGAATAALEAVRSASSDPCRIRFLGHVGNVPELLAATDVFAFPSLYEGLGGALIEAMALGLPVVASDIPPIREVVDDGVNADLVPPGEPDALASAIDALISDVRRRRSYGQASLDIFRSRFSLEASVAGLVSLYEAVLLQ